MNLDVKEIIQYFPYDLRLVKRRNSLLSEFKHKWEYDGTFTYDRLLLFEDGIPCSDECQHQFKVLLRPLTDLLKEEFWMQLLKLSQDRNFYRTEYKPAISESISNYKAKIKSKNGERYFVLSNHDDKICKISLNEPDRCSAVYYNWMIKNHFDVNDLIGRGFALDINQF